MTQAIERLDPEVCVVIVDDSQTSRRWIRRVLENARMRVVGEAGNGREGRDRIVEHDPDVVVLDLEMPDVDGLTLLRAVMKHAPRPIVVLSGADPSDQKTIAALEAGAAHVLAKPSGHGDAAAMGTELAHRVRQAAKRSKRLATQEIAVAPVAFAPRQLVAIGASTGGPGAIKTVLAGLPPVPPPIVITQHAPAHAAASFATRLGQTTHRDVRLARDGEVIGSGTIRVAPPDRHLLVEWSAQGYVTRLGLGAPECLLRPAVDVMFRSVAQAAGARAVGVLLTGMGDDGAAGLSVMHEAGCYTIAQDEATCVVFGMPRAAIALGAASAVVELERVAPTVTRVLRKLER